jgi:HEAT repeat protein
MSNEARHAVVAALIELAGSPDYRDRADAGRSLASFAEMPEARGPLLELVLDDGDTFVTRVTAEALLRRQDSAGLAVVASALGTVGPDHPNHADWIHTAVLDVFMVFSRDRDAAVRVCEVLARDPDEQVRCGADQLIAALAGINPILRPAQDD